jgi:CheY-like chemotaxis protein
MLGDLPQRRGMRREIAESIDGSDSVGPPGRRTEVSPGKTNEGDKSSAAGAGKHLLVVNDTPELLELFAALLGAEGYQVTTDRFTAEVGEVLQRVRDLQPDLLVLDFMIGREGLGWQLLQMLRMDRATRAIPVVVCTAAVAVVTDLKAHLDEMDVAVVLKPFDIDHLLAVIANRLRPAVGAD